MNWCDCVVVSLNAIIEIFSQIRQANKREGLFCFGWKMREKKEIELIN